MALRRCYSDPPVLALPQGTDKLRFKTLWVYKDPGADTAEPCSGSPISPSVKARPHGGLQGLHILSPIYPHPQHTHTLLHSSLAVFPHGPFTQPPQLLRPGSWSSQNDSDPSFPPLRCISSSSLWQHLPLTAPLCQFSRTRHFQ